MNTPGREVVSLTTSPSHSSTLFRGLVESPFDSEVYPVELLRAVWQSSAQAGTVAVRMIARAADGMATKALRTKALDWNTDPLL